MAAPGAPLRGPAPLRRGLVLLGFLVPVVLGIGFAVAALWEIGRQLDSVRAAQSDNMTWTVAQLEVDLLNHAIAVERGAVAGAEDMPAALADVRRSFDVLYSRAVILDRRARLRSGPDHGGFEARLMQRMTGLTATIDQDDGALARDLASLQSAIGDLRPVARAYVLDTLQTYLSEGDQRRQELRNLLRSFVVVGIVLIVALSCAVWLVLIVFRAERRRAIEGERMSSNLRSIIEASLDAMIVADADACVVHYNSAAARIFGRDRHDVAGRPLGALGLVEDLTHARVRALLDDGVTADLPPRRTMTGLRSDGSRFPVEASFARDLDTDGRVMLMAFLRDV
ncbi:PAS domain S-box protein, partial [Aphanothece microscopica]|uniref:PAS domain S-box protein n=1 Tax=Aphanothece microscopica TaxID=1049561 RepID=UPI003984D24B